MGLLVEIVSFGEFVWFGLELLLGFGHVGWFALFVFGVFSLFAIGYFDFGCF